MGIQLRQMNSTQIIVQADKCVLTGQSIINTSLYQNVVQWYFPTNTKGRISNLHGLEDYQWEFHLSLYKKIEYFF